MGVEKWREGEKERNGERGSQRERERERVRRKREREREGGG